MSGQVSGCATTGGGVDRDIQPGVAHRVVGAVETACVAHLGPDHYRGQWANAVVRGLQRLACRLTASDPVDLLAHPAQLLGQSLDRTLRRPRVDLEADDIASRVQLIRDQIRAVVREQLRKLD